MKDGVPFVWGEDQQKAFTELKERIQADVVLPHPDYSVPFILDTDACDSALGAVLSQLIGGQERPIAFASRSLSIAERKWSITEKEALGIIWGLKHFKHFLLGSEFSVRTDHSPLQVLHNAKTGRLARWAVSLGEFGDFGITHRAGTKHGNADALSRLADSDTVADHHVFAMIPKPMPKGTAFLVSALPISGTLYPGRGHSYGRSRPRIAGA